MLDVYNALPPPEVIGVEAARVRSRQMSLLAPRGPDVATEDAYGAVRWVADHLGMWHGDRTRVAVAGASAGATLATVATQLARDRSGPPICFQLLLVPGTDMEHDYPSYRENAEGFGLTRNTMRWFGKHYFRDPAERLQPQASPLRAASLAGLPPAAILTAQYDPMRDEGKAYADALRAAGVPVRHQCYEGFIHLRLGPDADRDMVAHLRAAFEPGAGPCHEQ